MLLRRRKRGSFIFFLQDLTLRKRVRGLVVFGCLAFFCFAFRTSEAATGSASLYFSPSHGTYTKGQNFIVSVLVNAETSINGVEAVLSFPPSFLEVLRIDKSGSIINLWVEEPSFSNTGSSGNVSLGGVILNPGFIGPSGKIVDIVFRVKNTGSAVLKYSQAAILANDGIGTNITALNDGAAFVFLDAKPSSGKEYVPPLSTTTPSVVVIKEIPEVQKPEKLLELWDLLPSWIKTGSIILIGLAFLIGALILLSFGLIILIYVWKYALAKREATQKKIRLVFGIVKFMVKFIVQKTVSLVRATEIEFEGDIRFTVEQFRRELGEASNVNPPRFGDLVKGFWHSLGIVIKRFFTRNTPDSASGLPEVIAGEQVIKKEAKQLEERKPR